MAFVGIDQSYTGFGLIIINAQTGEHHAHLGKFDLAKYPHQQARLRAIENWLLDNLQGWLVDGIAMEGYNAGAKFGREMSGELGATVKRALYERHAQQLLPTVIPPTSLKKFATGSGTAKKAEMLLGVYKRWGAEFKDDNLADAYVLAKIAECIADPSLDRTKFQQEVLDKLSAV